MNNSVQHVLTCLQKHKNGVTADMFRKGHRLGARIFDLRQMGYDIVTMKRDDNNPCARYVLRGSKQSNR